MVNINKKIWNEFSDIEMESYLAEVFNHYKLNGFPFFNTDPKYRLNEYRKMVEYDYRRVLLGNDIIGQSMHGLSLAWSYMPHSWDVVCNNKITPLAAFENDEMFKKVIAKRVKMGDNMSDNGIRKMLKIFSGVQSVSNFRPTAAAAIYSLFCNENDTVWDMSAGFGGRMLGAKLAKVNYIGTDPSTKTFNGLVELSHDFKLDAELHLIGSEDFKPMDNSLDFCFTSPPYFDTEQYSNEPTQSYMKYKTKIEWIDGYLTQTFENAYRGLQVGKYMAINIADVPSFNNLEQVVIDTAIQCGFKYTKTLKLALSNITMKSNKSKFKYEPIFIFKKGF